MARRMVAAGTLIPRYFQEQAMLAWSTALDQHVLNAIVYANTPDQRIVIADELGADESYA